MTSLEIKAIKALPEEYEIDFTSIILATSSSGSNRDIVVATSPDLPPMVFMGGVWTKIKTHASDAECVTNTILYGGSVKIVPQ